MWGRNSTVSCRSTVLDGIILTYRATRGNMVANCCTKPSVRSAPPCHAEHTAAMRTVLSSWKEIAQYVGKSVRTVQRWERDFGLPIRRPSANCHHAVLALAEEIDAWVRQKAQPRSGERADPELERFLRRETELLEENEALRAQLHGLAANPDMPSESDRYLLIRQVN